MKKTIFFLLLALFLSLANPALAVQFKTGDQVNFDKSSVINETVFVSGKNIDFQSKLNGDLFCAGMNIVISGDIKGDVICAGQNIKVLGNVDGDIRVVGQSIDVEGVVSRNISFFGQDLALGSKSNVKGDILFGGQTIDLSGVGGRDLVGAGDKVMISGSLMRNAVITVTSVDVASNANVGGSIDYFVEKNSLMPQLMMGKNIKGEVRRHEFTAPEKPQMNVERQVKAASPILKVFETIFGIISFSLLSFVLIYFSTRRTNRVISLIEQKPVISGLIGLAVFVVAPIALMILCATIVGLPIAFVVFVVYALTLFIASLYPSILLGKVILIRSKSKTSSIYLAGFLGCLVVGLAAMVPVLGWLVAVVLFFMGLGASFLSYLPEK